MLVLVYLIGVVASIVATLTIMAQTAFWQRKEYRLDRILPIIFGRDEAAWPVWLELIALAIVTSMWGFVHLWPAWILLTVGSVTLTVTTLYHGLRVLRKGVLRPVLTKKALLVICGSVVALLAMAYGALGMAYYPVFWFSYVVLLTPLATALAVAVVNIPANIRKRQIITAARALRAKHRHLTVIGITGSYGKTSTKFFLQQLLTTAGYHAIATSEHRNAEFPVAEDMLRQLTDKVSHYVVEMGAYRRGEISALAALTSPRLGVITAISNQHAALFGSVKKLAKAKWELIEALPPTGTAVLNQDDKIIPQLANTYSGEKVFYSLNEPATVWVDDCVFLPQSVTATLHIKSKSVPISVPVVGAGMFASTIAAVAAAHALGVSMEAIMAGVSLLRQPPSTMNVIRAASGVTIIDDSYSASEGGTMAALEHLGRFPQHKKIVVFTPIIELGQEAKAVHLNLGKQLAKTMAHVLVYGNAHTTYLREGATSTVWNERFQVVSDAVELANILKKVSGTDTVVLLAGRVPSIVRTALLT